MKTTQIHIGTSGWSYKDWKELFYPKEIKATDWLSFYSKEFSATEINSSFYHLPKKQTVEKWVDSTPDDFTFCPKMSKYLTHFKKLHEPGETLERFFEVFEPMQKKMGPVLVQLPPSLKFDTDIAENFFQVLKKSYHEYSFALEVRHNTWMEQQSLELMSKYNIAFVVSQSGKGFPYGEIITAKDIYVRFHGPKELYASKYDDETLNKFGELFFKWKQEGKVLWIFFNNDYFGYALDNARTLKSLCNEK